MKPKTIFSFAVIVAALIFSLWLSARSTREAPWPTASDSKVLQRLNGVWVGTEPNPTYLVFLEKGTFTEFVPGYRPHEAVPFEIDKNLRFRASYPFGEEGESTEKVSQFELSEDGLRLKIPSGTLFSDSEHFRRVTPIASYLSEDKVPKATNTR